MAGLQNIREGLTGPVSKFIVVLIIITFALFFGWGTVFSTSDANTVASVDNKKLDLYDLDFEMRTQQYYLNQRLQEDKNDMNIDEDLLREISINSIISRALILNYLEESGIKIPDSSAYKEISLDQTFLENNKFSKARFEAVARSLGYIPSEYLERIKQDMLLKFWQNGIGESSFVTEDEVKNILRLAGQTRDITFIKLKFSDFKNQFSPNSDEKKAFYKSNNSLFQTEEKANLKYIELSDIKLRDKLKISEDQLKEEYSSYLGDFDTSTRRSASHIEIKVTNKRTREAALSLASELKEMAESGQDFSALVVEFSEDEGSKNTGGDLGVSDGTTFPVEFENALKSLEEGQVSDPVVLGNSIHVLKLLKVQIPTPKSFDSMRLSLKESLEDNLISSRFSDLLDRASNLVFTSGSLDSISEELQIPVLETGLFVKEFAPNPFKDSNLLESLFLEREKPMGYLSDLIELSKGQAIIYEVIDFQEKKILPYGEVESEVLEELVKELAEAEISKKSNQILIGLREKISFNSIADKNGLKLESYKGVQRNSSLLPSTTLLDLFNVSRADQSPLGESILENNDRIIYMVEAINDVEEIFKQDQTNAFSTFLNRERKLSELAEIQSSLKQSAKISIYNSN